jgi:hypothetical protein
MRIESIYWLEWRWPSSLCRPDGASSPHAQTAADPYRSFARCADRGEILAARGLAAGIVLVNPSPSRGIWPDTFVCESNRVVRETIWPLDPTAATRVDYKATRCPVLVLAGGRDRAHFAIAEPGWEQVASAIRRWVPFGALEIDRWILARFARRPILVFWLDALVARPRFNQRSFNGEMLVAEEFCRLTCSKTAATNFRAISPQRRPQTFVAPPAVPGARPFPSRRRRPRTIERPRRASRARRFGRTALERAAHPRRTSACRSPNSLSVEFRSGKR